MEAKIIYEGQMLLRYPDIVGKLCCTVELGKRYSDNMPLLDSTQWHVGDFMHGDKDTCVGVLVSWSGHTIK
jgi:hypothetical protein